MNGAASLPNMYDRGLCVTALRAIVICCDDCSYYGGTDYSESASMTMCVLYLSLLSSSHGLSIATKCIVA